LKIKKIYDIQVRECTILRIRVGGGVYGRGKERKRKIK
jgi:hypothetical protein